MSQQEHDLSAAWHAHAPPPPPIFSSSSDWASSSKPRRRTSSLDPATRMARGYSFDAAAQGGVLPPDSFSPEPARPSSSSASSHPSTLAGGQRMKTSSNPTPPPQNHYDQLPQSNPSYNSQPMQQQRSQQQTRYPPPAPSHIYARTRFDSTPTPVAYNHHHQGHYQDHSQIEQQQQQQSTAQSQYPHTPPGTSSYYQTSAVPITPAQYAGQVALPSQPYHIQTTSSPQQDWRANPPTNQPYVQQQQSFAAVAPQTFTASGPQPVPSAYYYPSPPSSSNATFVEHINQPNATGDPGQPNPIIMGPPATPAAVASLSRTSTVSSTAASRRPLPQPGTSSPVTSSSPVTAQSPLPPTYFTHQSPLSSPSRTGSVRRTLPQPPPGQVASPTQPSSVKLPVALNRAESVRHAAEALMARGPPQRRPLRSALGQNTFTPSTPSSPPPSSTISSSQSDPQGQRVGEKNQVRVPSPSQSAGPGVPNASWNPAEGGRTTSTYQDSRGESHQDQVARQEKPAQGMGHPSPQRRTLPSQPARYTPVPPRSKDSIESLSEAMQRATTNDVRLHPATFGDPPRIEIEENKVEKPRRRGSSFSPSNETSSTTVPAIRFPGQTDDDEEESNSTREIMASTSSAKRRSLVGGGGGGGGGGNVDVVGPPSISISGPEVSDKEVKEKEAARGTSPGVPAFTFTLAGSEDGGSQKDKEEDEDEDDARSQASSKGPTISVSFSAGDASVIPQRAGSSESGGCSSSPSETKAGSKVPRARSPGAASASSVGTGASCASCAKYIAGRVVHAMSSTYHPSCFSCAHCSEPLEHVAFYEHQGLPYCHFDYHELFSKRCFHCRTPIVDERFITVQDQELGEGSLRCYHELHFFCANCGDPFLDPKAAGSAAGADPGLVSADEDGKIQAGGMAFVVHKGYPYCEKCHINLHKPRCKACKKPIVTDLVSALNAKWHPECFVCKSCRRPFEDTSFYVKDGEAFDEECYKVLLRNQL
ncbi:hypothetical protein IE53DRAFT_208782 [Violaceomyces palustris]|uniref:Uncharacterized protein n=1 Tax=Violaceomyces palustris TaxID=1673888 RepID=A0ACD0P520_9BASI|nr:hypothetical protein IE53DRAFT_208782 [Violaceomyces palustris]